MRSTSVGDTEMLQSTAPSATQTTSLNDLYSQRIQAVNAHRAILGALYHVPVAFPACWSLNDPFIDLLAENARFYGYGTIIQVQIHSYLRQESQRLSVLKHCDSHSYEMLEFEVGIEADWIVKEAAVYILNQDAKQWAQGKAELDEINSSIATVLAEKRHKFEQKLRDADLALFQIGLPSPAYKHQLPHRPFSPVAEHGNVVRPCIAAWSPLRFCL